MTITTNEARELKKRIGKLVQAEVERTLKGTGNENPFTNYDEELRVARKRLKECIEALKLPDGRIRP